MIVLIAESKTMASCDAPVSPQQYSLHRPQLEGGADMVMDRLRAMDAAMLSAHTRLSPQMVRRLQAMIYDFPHKSAGAEAAEAYTGVVFRALDFPSLPQEAKIRAYRSVAIVSSLYGWLRPDDVVKPYRLDFNMKVAPEGRSLAAYWRSDVTRMLAGALERQGETDVLDLLPADAAGCINRKMIAAKARVWKADFKEVTFGGELRTPDAGWLKRLRGRLLRQILVENTTSPDELAGIEGDGYIGVGADGAAGVIRFHTAR